MRKIKLLAGAALFMLASCNFSEECIYYGTCKISLDWSEINGESAIPSVNEMNLILYPLTGEGLSKMPVAPEPFNSLSFQKELLVGDYDVFVYNPATYIMQNPTSSKEAMLTISTIADGAKKYINQELLPVYVAASESMTIAHEDTTNLVLKPMFFLQILEFHINVKNMIKVDVKQIDAELEGVATQKYMLSAGIGEDFAIQQFTALKNEEEKNRYDKSIRVLGINNTVSNQLDLSLLFEDGHEVRTSVDLSEKLKNFTAAKAVIELEVLTGEYNTEASIQDWHEVDWGELQYTNF
ncbi:DUF5119 domain-containing protein [Bacteroides fragilis]|uniref:DUF5119 domain-containing protein n=1 Tax=Bacteroides fragilis TaxID=817 RepID=UPI001C708629|nr:DUF5119 domain-containing protein [Bacteroides fragilis]MBW9280186.1 DUF5119 domain-containing protein [Bacteroides fragilis]